MNSELRRIATFKGLSAKMPQGIQCLSLARAGFFSADDILKTFCCKLEVKPHEIGSNPKEFHLKKSPNCSFFNASDSAGNSVNQNRPFEPSGNSVGPEITRSAYPPDTSSPSLDRSFIKDARSNPTPEFMEDMKSVSQRLETFFDFPAEAPVTTSQLAEAGFFYMGTRDRVRCAFCKGTLHSWEPDDVPINEHRLHFPTCPFLNEGGKQPTATKAVINENQHDTKQDISEKELSEENASLQESTQCRVCMDQARNIVFLPCGHLVTCGDCAPRLRFCPVCRALIKGTVKAFLS